MWGREEQRPYQGQSGYSGAPHSNGPPQLPPPWISEWDAQSQRYYFVNQQTGERRWDPPSQYYNGPPNQAYGGAYPPADNRGQEKKHHGSGLGWGLAGAAAGLAGGALLMHEGHEIKDDLREDKYRLENGVDNAAYWAGDKVQDVEDIPQDIGNGFDRLGNRIEQGWDNSVDYVEGAPDRIANNVGEAVGDVENFGDRVGDRVENFGDGLQDSYEDGRDDSRNDGW